MSKQAVGVGSAANDSTGDTLRAGGVKINANFDEIYTAIGDGTTLAPFTSTAINTLSKLNAIVADATLIDTGDSRLSDARTPTAHAASHASGGSDALTPAAIGAATAAQGDTADTAVQPARAINTGTGLEGGGDLSADRTLALNAAALVSLDLADSAVQPGDLATVATTGAYADLSGTPTIPVEIGIACSDETTDLTTGTAKAMFRMPHAMTLTAVRASVTTAPVGSTMTIDINEGGTTILSTKLTIDASEKTSTTAATPPVISDSALADDAEITVDIDQIGSSTAGAGLKIWLIGTRA